MRSRISLKAIVFICILGCFAAVSWFWKAAAEIQDLGQIPAWLKLLHYKKRSIGGFRSEVKSADFFLSPRGKQDPEAELAATIAIFESHGRIGPHHELAACVFPARFDFLSRSMPGHFPPESCPEFDSWRNRLNADSVTLVFSSYYQGAPASMFGHTFLRLNRTKLESVLDTSLDYSAFTDGDSILIQAPLGLVGYYRGDFSMLPYYIKIKEYNNAENRDLFEYNLNFDHQDVQRLLAHLWEMQNAHMHYYFFTRNCSYEILALLEAAKPEWQLRKKFRLQVIPIDTVRAVVSQPGALRDAHYRPSLKRRLHAKWLGLSRSSRADYFEIIKGGKSPSAITDPLLAESLGLHYAIRQIEKHGTLPPAEAQTFHAVNLRRSQLESLDDSAYQPKILPRPDLAHGTLRWSLGAGVWSHGLYWQPEARPALHELVERDAGYTPDSTLEAFKLRMRFYQDTGHASINEAELLHILALSPIDALERRISYDISMGLYNPPDAGCEQCLAGNFRFGVGGAVDVGGHEHFTVFAMSDVQVDSGNLYEHGFRFGPGLRVGSVLRKFDRYKAVLDAGWNHFLNENSKVNLWSSQLTQSYSWSAKTETHFKAQWIGGQFEATLMQHFYF